MDITHAQLVPALVDSHGLHVGSHDSLARWLASYAPINVNPVGGGGGGGGKGLGIYKI